MVIDKIYKNYDFWKKIKPQLEKFYMECLLPELIDSRFDPSVIYPFTSPKNWAEFIKM